MRHVSNRPAFTLIELPKAVSKGFTLIELLVVITIIVVLLALLTPALEKAVYQAQLAVCGSKLYGVGTGVHSYAWDHKRSFPNRPGLRGGTIPYVVHRANVLPDERKMLQPYISIKDNLLCSLASQRVDLGAAPQSHTVSSSYTLYFGAQYKNPDGGMFKGMLRVGDRLEWDGDTYAVLAADLDYAGAATASSHPDREGLMTPWVAPANYTFSLWQGPPSRSELDTNYVMSDGSVIRYDGVTYDEAQGGGRQRMAKVPLYTDGANLWPARWLHVPDN